MTELALMEDTPAKNEAKKKEPAFKTIDIFPTARQNALINCPADTIFYGGARGGGKTYGMGILILQRVQKYGRYMNIIFFRRTNPELEDAIKSFSEIFGKAARWIVSAKKFVFWNGAELRMRFIDKMTDYQKYQGHQYSLIIFDEVTNFESYNLIERMRGCLRSGYGIPTQLIMSGNPGGPLHNRLKMEFVDPFPKGDVLLPDGYSDKLKRPLFKCFIPSFVTDNPYLINTGYVDNLKKSGTAAQVRQWLYGDWNNAENAAFADLWDPVVHVVAPFRIPFSWQIVKSYDYGSSHPWACVWFAISDGTDYVGADGKSHPTIKDDLFAIYELYGWTGQPNEGDKASIKEQAEKIKLVESTYLKDSEVLMSIADSAIFANSSGQYCVSDDFEANGVFFQRCKKGPGSREQGYTLLRERLLASRERDASPGIFWFRRCQQSIRTIPMLQLEKDGSDKVATSGASEDHLYDLTCYLLLEEEMGEVQSSASGNY